MSTTMIPKVGDAAPLPRIADHDDTEVDWSAIEAQGVAWREARERETARPSKGAT